MPQPDKIYHSQIHNEHFVKFEDKSAIIEFSKAGKRLHAHLRWIRSNYPLMSIQRYLRDYYGSFEVCVKQDCKYHQLTTDGSEKNLNKMLKERQ